MQLFRWNWVRCPKQHLCHPQPWNIQIGFTPYSNNFNRWKSCFYSFEIFHFSCGFAISYLSGRFGLFSWGKNRSAGSCSFTLDRMCMEQWTRKLYCGLLNSCDTRTCSTHYSLKISVYLSTRFLGCIRIKDDGGREEKSRNSSLVYFAHERIT